MTGSSRKILQDLLKGTLENELPGSWRSGQQEGNWWLKGLRDNRAQVVGRLTTGVSRHRRCCARWTTKHEHVQAVIEGTVLDSKGHAVPYATVACVPGPEHRNRRDLYQQDTTDQQGHFSLRGLNLGAYMVPAWETWKMITATRSTSNRTKPAARAFGSMRATGKVSR
jgi:hypothetical protein